MTIQGVAKVYVRPIVERIKMCLKRMPGNSFLAIQRAIQRISISLLKVIIQAISQYVSSKHQAINCRHCRDGQAAN